ncbi:MAG: hypothetical protein ACYTKD_25860 [Planctomycetota bacterium]|jgi:hypothetical protein
MLGQKNALLWRPSAAPMIRRTSSTSRTTGRRASLRARTRARALHSRFSVKAKKNFTPQ